MKDDFLKYLIHETSIPGPQIISLLDKNLSLKQNTSRIDFEGASTKTRLETHPSLDAMFAAVNGTDANEHLDDLRAKISGETKRKEHPVEEEAEEEQIIVTIGAVVRSITNHANQALADHRQLLTDARSDSLVNMLLDLDGTNKTAKNLALAVRQLEAFLQFGGALLNQDIERRVALPEQVHLAIQTAQSLIGHLVTNVSEGRRSFARNQLTEYARMHKMTFDALLDRRAEYHQDRLPPGATEAQIITARKIYSLLCYFAKERELEQTARKRAEEAERMSQDRKTYLRHAAALMASGKCVVDRASDLRNKGVLAKLKIN